MRGKWPTSIAALAMVVLLGSLAAARADEIVELRLASGPHGPSDAPDVGVHVPSRALRAQRALHWVVFLHGFKGCVRALLGEGETPCTREGPVQDGFDLARIHERAGTDTLLVVPQLAFVARSSRAKRFEQGGGFDAMLRAVRERLAPLLGGSYPPASVTLVAHSAGYRAAATILSDPSRAQAVRAVVLFDALYAQWNVFADWFQRTPNARLVSLYTSGTERGNRKLTRLLRDGRKKLPERARIERVSTPHRFVPERHLESVLIALFGTR